MDFHLEYISLSQVSVSLVKLLGD